MDAVAPDAAADPVALLLECHTRIRRFCGGLDAIAAHLGSGDARIGRTARECARYFREALPLHAEDEDRSVLPRLQAGPAGARMGAEHAAAALALPALLADLDAIAGGGAPEGYAGRAAAFRADLLQHIEAEERDVFPAIGALPAPVRADIVAEMRARRGVG